MKRILVPVDGSESSLHGVRHVVRQFFLDSALEVHLVHVRIPLSRYVARFIDARARSDYHQQLAESAVAAARNLLRQHSVPHVVHLGFGDPVCVIADTAQRVQATEIVMGTTRKNLLVRFIQDSVSARVTEAVNIPVQLVTGKLASTWERIGVPAVVSAALAALFLAAAD